MSVERIGVRMHGVSLNLHCDYGALLEHTACLLEGYTGAVHASPDLEVNAHWLTAGDGDGDGRRSFFDSDGLDGFGKRMLLGADELVWPDTHRNKDLQLRFGRRDRTLVFDVAYRYAPSAKKLAKYEDYERKKFFDLLRYLVLFPVAWHLERTRGWFLIHAAAVADGDRGLLIAGPGGSGKTTTSVALLARGLTMITENLLFCDGREVRPLCEPVRLTDESLALLGDGRGGLEPLAGAGRLKYKSMYRLPPAAGERAVTPRAMFFPRFSRQGFVRPIAPAVAGEILRAVNRLTLELNDYDWYSAALDLLWPRPDQAQRQLDALRLLTGTTPCYDLGIERAAGVGPVVDRILQCAGAAPRAVSAGDAAC